MLLFCLVVAGIGTAILLALRYWVLPDIEHYHTDVTMAASVAVGRPVTIAHIEADWSGLRPRLLLSDVKILDERGQTALEFPLLRNTIAWTTLFTGELRLYSLELDGPQLLVRRDAQGRHYVAGILSGEQAAVQSDEAGSDWLLHQSRIVVHNGHVIWQDEMRGAPAIAFEQVEMVIENRGERHRFALHASPPGSLASSIDLRGDLYGESFAELNNWSGDLFGLMDEMDVSAWSKWIDLPDAFKSGKGAVRVWLGMTRGQVNQVDADISLRNVNAQLASDLPVLDLRRISGRVGWHQTDNVFEISTRQLSWLTRDGFELKPTDLSFSLAGRKGYQSASGEIGANEINLADAKRIIAYLPVAETWKKRISDISPLGHVSGLKATWQGGLEHPSRFKLSARFENIGLHPAEGLPGITGLSGEVEGSDREGRLQLGSRNLTVQAENFLSETLAFDRFNASIDWQRNERGWDLKLNHVQVSNADLEGTVSGGYQINDGPGVADISINLTRASVKHAARYIPMHAFDDLTYHWLQTGLQEGVADIFKMRVHGDLRRFPFPDSKDGLFKIEAQAKNVAIEFDPGWPRIEQAAASLLIQGRRLEVGAASAMTAGAGIQNTTVVLPDTLADDLVLQIKGTAAGATQRSLDYIRYSPVRGYLDGFTDDFRASGDGLLMLQLDIPLNGKSAPKVKGSFQFINNEVDLGEQIPLMRNVTGTLFFTGDGLQANDIDAQILGGPAHINLRSENGTLSTRASGRLNADNLPENYTYPLLKRLHGATNWTAEVNVKSKLAEVQVDSDLAGLASELPQPFTKPADEVLKVHFEMKDTGERQDRLRLRYGGLINADLTRVQSVKGGGYDIKRGEIVIGNPAGKAGKDGVWVTGSLPQFALEGWSGWADLPRTESASPNISGINVTIGKVYGYGNIIHQLNVRGSGRAGLVSTRLTSRELNGDVIWQPQDEGKLLVRLKNAMLGEDVSSTAPEKANQATGPIATSQKMSLPIIDMAIDNLTWKGRQQGKLEMLMKSRDGDVVLEKLQLSNPDGVFNVSGIWSAEPQQTKLNAKVEIINSGRLLARSGYQESIKDGSGTLESELQWNGSPDEFNFGSLDGTLRLKTGKGQFMQVNPGAAKLLGVLSLQSLPKRISLDFTDVLSPGFEFDSIVGEAVIEHGLLKTSDFKMSGAAAKIILNGQVDLEHETQKLRVRVLPAIGDNVSLLSFAAGPAIGVSVLLANKILSDPLDKLVSFDYNVTGSWADPKVERVSAIKGITPPADPVGFPAN